ncbi:hypothetical protein FRC17_003486 [Serendipita sp. 399]|nr:hypothetical protein FRC17_003486 [Serendipita sp. 399]
MSSDDRRIVLCFDGTANEFDDTNTNVVKLCSLLQMNNAQRQLVYYQPGIGTWTAPGIRGRIHRWIANTLDLAVAWYISGHIMAGYEYLMNNHLPGDKICIFGFSRGAYTARALAGMLHCVGLLPKDNHEQVSFAYRMYKQQNPLAADFKRTFSKDVEIEMLGVWDTVASVGLLIPQTLPFTSSDTVKTFRHAVSCDEHRTKWGITLWDPTNEAKGTQYGSVKTVGRTVEEVWFAGAHSDVGGGSDVDNAPICLANISLRWMLHEIVKADCGILFDNASLDRLGIPYECVPRILEGEAPLIGADRWSGFASDGIVQEVAGVVTRLANGKTLNSTHVATSASGKGKLTSMALGGQRSILSWKDADEADAVAPIFDQLKIHPILWLFQIPSWDAKRKRLDFTGHRHFPSDDARKRIDSVHWTVAERMKEVKGYTPRAHLPVDWQTDYIKH